MRLCFLLVLQEPKQTINSIEGLHLVNREEWEYPRIIFRGKRFICFPVDRHKLGTSKLWHLILITPEDGDYKDSAALFRLLKKSKHENIMYIMSPKQFKKKHPIYGRNYFQSPIYDEEGNISSYNNDFRLPIVILGDNPETLAEVDYDPTDKEIDDDTDPDPVTIGIEKAEEKEFPNGLKELVRDI